MTGADIRSKFLQYFAAKDHAVVADSSLVPQDDPTLLFTNAGMVQFKRVFMGEEKRPYSRAATCQRCVRAGGKHNDLENVGHTARHHTFFEMLGNFSFGDYFKEEAIHYAWEFLTRELGLDPRRLWVSVFEDDDEAYGMWEKVEDLPKGRILRMGEKDNFWAMGDTGPCGPCSEIHIDQGPEVGCGAPDCRVGCPNDCDRFLELWNLVFMQFYRDEAGTMTRLPKPSIDTGMGLERITAVLQGKQNNYDSDLFADHVKRLEALTGKPYGVNDQHNIAMRVIADHARATAFLVADGVLPSNEGRGYVLRRIMRRAIRYGRYLGIDKPFLAAVTAGVVEKMAPAFPHLREAATLLDQVATNEEVRFRETLDNGLAMLQEEIERLRATGTDRVSGSFVFKLYDTFGFPVDIVRDIAMEKGIGVDEAGFAEAMEKQRQRSKQSWKEGGLAALSAGIKALADAGHKSRFVGYDCHRNESPVAGLIDAGGEAVDKAAAGATVSLFCPETVFYAESGGQTGDTGEVIGANGRGLVRDTITVGDGIVLHETEITEGFLAVGETVSLRVAEGRRQTIANNHTATHLLHTALKTVLGDHVKQSGSLVEAERLRFDFTHFSPISPEDLARIEDTVNREIRANTRVGTELLSRDQAIASGATALFGEKYADTVRVVGIGAVSRELCGGTHVGRTGEIGLFKIIAETGIAAGIRRIEAVTGPGAFARFRKAEEQLDGLAATLKSGRDELASRLEKLLSRQKELEKQVATLTARLSLADLDGLIASAPEVGGVRVLAADMPVADAKTLREVGDRVRDKLGSGVVVLGAATAGDKVTLLAMVSKDLTGRLQAGNIVKQVAGLVGGSGGGRPDMAQAGGTMPDKLAEALAAVPGIVSSMLA